MEECEGQRRYYGGRGEAFMCVCCVFTARLFLCMVDTLFFMTMSLFLSRRLCISGFTMYMIVHCCACTPGVIAVVLSLVALP